MALQIDAIFHAAHTFKGSAELFGFNAIVGFTHSVESVLEQVRAGAITLDAPLCELQLDCHKQMSTMIDVIAGGPDSVDIEMGARLITALNDYLAPKPSFPPPEEPVVPALNDARGIQIAYRIDVFRDGMDIASQISYLSKLGSLDAISPRFHWPENFAPEACYLNLSLVLVTDANKQTIEDVFEFIKKFSETHIQAPLKITGHIKAIPQQVDKPGEVLLEAGVVTKRELNQALEQQKTQHDKAVGELLVAQGVEHSSVVEEAVNRQAHQEHSPGIVIVQHMPEKFTAAFAQRLNSPCEIDVKEAQSCDRVCPELALLAAGGQHMTLTRMGDDGARGQLEMREAGADTFAQDEASSVVFGMPKEAIKRGGAMYIVDLTSVPESIMSYSQG